MTSEATLAAPARPVVVTFTTDFGTADGYVGAMKGVVLSLAPDAILVDITHEVSPYDVAGGAFALAQAAPLFPAGSIHIAVVDPQVGGARAAIVVEAAGAYFVGPDNGVLSLAATGPRVAHQIAAPGFRREPVSPTFHGRDIFAPCAGKLASGAVPRDAGPLLPAIADLALPDRDDPRVATVLHVDRFGNLVTSLSGDVLEPGGWRIGVPGTSTAFAVPAARTYADVELGALLAYVGSSGLVELAVREGSAAKKTGLGRGSVIRLRKADES
ncbi:MAG TPA: SAM-dependent chlorinase/fluorinase [Polyangia bacterium]